MAYITFKWTNPNDLSDTIELSFDGEITDGLALNNFSSTRTVGNNLITEYTGDYSTFEITVTKITPSQYILLKILLTKGTVELISSDGDINMQYCTFVDSSIRFTKNKDIVNKVYFYNGILNMEEN